MTTTTTQQPPPATSHTQGTAEKRQDQGWWRWWLQHLGWAPKWTRWDPEAENELSWGLNILFGVTAAFSVANLYYSTPILHVLAEDFEITDQRASLVPTVTQAGYAGGLLFIIPLGDLVRRRPFTLALIFLTAILWLGATLTPSYPAFLALSFLVGLLTVTPQLMFPLTMQYAPVHHRATMTSVLMSGVTFGILVARLISGIVADLAGGWRYVYWVSFALQVLLGLLLFAFMPDYPVLQPGGSYLRTLRKIVTMPLRSPVLVQMSLIAFLVLGMFTSFWTTLTFQLEGVFGLSTLAIGLFALVGLCPVFLNPVVSRLLISKIHTSGTLLVALGVTLAGVCVGTFVGTFSLAGPVLWACLGDLGMTAVIVGNRMAIAKVDVHAQNAVNSVYMVFTFCGQLFGTAVGNSLFATGGWTYSGALSIAQLGAAILLVLARGPHEKGWVGWGGGWDLSLPKAEEEEDAAQPEARSVRGPEGDIGEMGERCKE